MQWIVRLGRHFAKMRFRLLGLATIKDIPTEQFNKIIRGLIDEGWTKIYEYTGFDAWIDYGCVKLRKGDRKLKFEWDNWTEGSIEGLPHILEDIASVQHLPLSSEWRWAEYDDN